MAQHDLIIDNAGGAVVRADINAALAALGSCMKGSSPPAFPLAGMLWLEEDNPSATAWTLRIYDGADWSAIGVLNSTTNVFTPSAAPDTALLKAGDTMTGALTLPSSDPTDPNHAARKAYVDARVLKSGDTMTGALTLPASDPTDANHAARKAYVDAGDRWVQIASADITNIATISATWTGGNYTAYKAYIIGAKPASATSNGLVCQIRQGGSFVSGASGYNRNNVWWNNTGNHTPNNSAAIHTVITGGSNGEPIFSETTISQAVSTDRPVIVSQSRWTDNSPTHAMGIFTSNVWGGSGWVDGIQFYFNTASPNFAAAGKVIIVGLKA